MMFFYTYDRNYIFTGVVKSESPIENATIQSPFNENGLPLVDGLLVFNSELDKWEGKDFQEYAKQVGIISDAQPSETGKQIAALTMELATERSSSAKNIAALTLQVATLTKTVKELNNGGATNV